MVDARSLSTLRPLTSGYGGCLTRPTNTEKEDTRMKNIKDRAAAARQWLGNTPKDADEFICKYFPSANILWEKDEEHGIVLKVSDQGEITTARRGDYIVRSAPGYHYACPKEMFKKIRDTVDEDNADGDACATPMKPKREGAMGNYTIRILGSEYAVARRDIARDNIMGQIDNMTRGITLQAGMGTEAELHVLLHEVFHGLEFALHFQLKEKMLHRLASGIHAFLLDNPSVTEAYGKIARNPLIATC
uniref:Uncharacterized protein n=1 Tax=Candidatus Kentrum sp. UNK TaxID=2126344 RepID=A0A451ARF0_9GAMM|nr:MAG: hypothetical protein BECKUNK1418G_GA0071005_100531 [Candidatus Kentron sp. UNK]VFK68608.1 MAG: hypothetical protein BECKUNK1418H_GA0071006_100431 [Candidatus Kentron sp. UNK]